MMLTVLTPHPHPSSTLTFSRVFLFGSAIKSDSFSTWWPHQRLRFVSYIARICTTVPFSKSVTPLANSVLVPQLLCSQPYKVPAFLFDQTISSFTSLTY